MSKRKIDAVVLIILGFLIGCMVMDNISAREELIEYRGAYDYGKLIFAVAERPKNCPCCGYEFVYHYAADQEELDELINKYLGD